MMIVWGDDAGVWQKRLDPFSGDFLCFESRALSGIVAPIYGNVIANRVVFSLCLDSEVLPLSALTLERSDSDERLREVLLLLRQLWRLTMESQRLSIKVSRLQGLWDKTRQRYRAYTKTMRAKLYLDPLTQILNRDGVARSLSGAVRDAASTGAHMTFLLLDLDWFKRINDGYGHAVGDVVLRHVALLLKEGVRRTDAVGRVGGEEFCAILQSCDRDAGVSVAEKLRLAVASCRICVAINEGEVPSVWAMVDQQCHVLSGKKPGDSGDTHVIALTISVGVATFPDDFMANEGSSRLLHAMGDVTEADMLQYMADKALYQAKKEGRNTVCSYRRGLT